MKQGSKTLKHSRKYMLLIFISLVFGGFAIIFTNTYLNNMIERSLLEIAKMGAKTVEQKVEWNLSRLDILSNLEIIYSDKYTVEEKLNYLRDTNEVSNSTEVAYITADGMLYGISGRKFDVSREKFFLKAMKSTRSVEKTDMKFFPIFPSIVFTAPVIHENKIKSFVSIIFSAEELCAMLEDITFGENGYGYIIDSEGVTIAHIDRSLVINKVSLNDADDDSGLKKLAEPSVYLYY